MFRNMGKGKIFSSFNIVVWLKTINSTTMDNVYGEGAIRDTTALQILWVVYNRQYSKAGSIKFRNIMQHKLERKFSGIEHFRAGQFILNPNFKGEKYKVKIQTASHKQYWRKCRVSCSFCTVLKLYFFFLFDFFSCLNIWGSKNKNKNNFCLW